MSVSNTRKTTPELKDNTKERPRKLANQKHEWKLFTNYKKFEKPPRKNSKQECCNLEIEVNRRHLD